MILTAKNWPFLRIYLLFFILGTTLAVLGKILFFPQKIQSLDQKFAFPSSVALSQWEFVSSTSITSILQRYNYRQGDNTLMIDAEIQSRSEGSINRMLMTYYKLKPATLPFIQTYLPNQGYTASFKLKDRLYLTACLNPIGDSTITEQQFISNRYKFGWGISRTFLWLIGQQDLFDGRCLWTIISSPLPDSPTESDLQKTYLKLEQAWFDWSHFWKGRW